jgi:hypothetical protein
MSAIATAIIASAVVLGGVSIYTGNQQEKAVKNAANDAQARNDKAIAEAKAAQTVASDQAQAQIDQKRRAMIAGSQTVFTNPLGLDTQATLTKKTLLGG